jgi:hypothetical protein
VRIATLGFVTPFPLNFRWRDHIRKLDAIKARAEADLAGDGEGVYLFVNTRAAPTQANGQS